MQFRVIEELMVKERISSDTRGIVPFCIHAHLLCDSFKS